MGLGAPIWRAIISGLNMTTMLAVGITEALTSLSVPGRVWVIWTIATVAFLAYSAHLTGQENERRAAATEKMIADLVERARKNGAQT